MKGDFTKFRFDPQARYTRVLKQQGRVDLDSDWNEYNDIREYLDRTTRIDTLGPYGVPVGGGGFNVSFNGADLVFSKGRLYVQGIQCELFQDTNYGTNPQQPFVPSPAPLNPVDGRTDAVIMDVWERHITSIENPDIREVALGGPDTTTRVETIFQISLIQKVGGITCAQVAFPQPSGGQMTPSLVPVPPSDDPCLISPTGGYRGLENRLYRVEIHDPGDLNQATFKWSRDNGSVVFPITEFPAGQPDRIRVTRLGRDQVLALHNSDYVEVLGDETELNQVAGTVAQITNITTTQDATGTSIFELSLSGPVNAHANEHSPKVRRWDQKSLPITVSATPIPLEDGLQVQFAGSNFRIGDWWTFAARTLGQPIEAQPSPPGNPGGPGGITHYYVPLALVTWHVDVNNVVAADVDDCRPKKPGAGCCCCVVTVGDGTNSQGDFNDLQQAIDSLDDLDPQITAEICILQGNYSFAQTITVSRDNLIIRGCGAETVILGTEDGPAFLINNHKNVTLASFQARSQSGREVIEAIACTNIAIEDCRLQGDVDTEWMIIAQSTGLRIENNMLVSGGAWVVDGSSRILIRGNDIDGSPGAGIGLNGLPEDIQPMGNSSGVADVRILSNRITQASMSGISTVVDAVAHPVAFADTRRLTIAGNSISGCARSVPKVPYHPAAVAGILLHNALDVRIRDNEIFNNGIEPATGGCGIFTQMGGGFEINRNLISNNGSHKQDPQVVCVDFRQKQAGQISNPSTFSGAIFTVGDANGVLPQATLVDSGGGDGIALDCSQAAIVLLPIPVNTVTLLVKNSNPAGGAVSVSAPGVTPVLVPSGPPQNVTLNGNKIQEVLIAAGNNSTGLLLQICFSNLTTYQAGIIALSAFGTPSLKITENIVSTPVGHSLIATGIGLMEFTNNNLTSGAFRLQPEWMPAQAVLILNTGITQLYSQTVFGVVDLATFRFDSTTSQPVTDVSIQEEAPPGPVLFAGNQVLNQPGRKAGAILPCLIGSFDDVAIENNQFEILALFTAVHVFAYGFTLRAVGNGFSTVRTALLSYLGFGVMNMVTENQAYYCVDGFGFLNLLQDNQVLATTLCQFIHGVLAQAFGG